MVIIRNKMVRIKDGEMNQVLHVPGGIIIPVDIQPETFVRVGDCN